LAFALIDGSHERADVLEDAMTVHAARVLCFDDMDRPGIRAAYNEALLLMPGRVGIFDESVGWKWEAYIV